MPDSKRVALLLDEIQYCMNWETWVKHSVDFKPEYKIVATGSAALDIQEKGKESGTGRWVTVKLPTLSFYEYLRMKQVSIPDLPEDFRVLNLIKKNRGARIDLLNQTIHLREHFHKYLLMGGFPELINLEDVDEAQRLLREDVVDKVLKRDMTSSFGVRHVAEMERLFIYLCIHSGGIAEKKTIADQLAVSPQTVERFLDYLESANLIYRLMPLKETGKAVLKARPKIHISDIALRNAVLLKNEDILGNPEEMGLSVETAVYKHFHTFYFKQKPIIGYWRDKNKEVDIVIKSNDSMIPVEVKYREQIQLKKSDGLLIFMDASKSKSGVIVTKKPDDFDIIMGPHDSKILKIPAFLLLFLLGHSERSLRRVGS